MSQLKRITDLFTEGKVIQIRSNDGEAHTFWVNKLTPFQQEEAAHAGRIARARVILALREIGNDESKMFDAEAAVLDLNGLIEAVLNADGMDYLMKAINGVRSDPEWAERFEVLEWSEDQLKGKPDDDPEVVLWRKLNRDYGEEIEKRQTALRNERRRELYDTPEAEVRELHRQTYLDERGLAAFNEEYSKHRVKLALRECNGTQDANGRWDHGSCDHSRRILDEASEVAQLPELIYQAVRGALQELDMSLDNARFSAGPANSSESSGPSSSQEDSELSGPAETPSEPDGTSSQP